MPRPTSVTIIAILAIIWGAFKTFSTPFLLLMHVIPSGKLASLPAFHDRVIMVFTIVGLVMNILSGILLLASGIGALSLKPWSRIGLICYAYFTIAYYFISAPLNWIVLQPRYNAYFATTGSGVPTRTFLTSVWGYVWIAAEAAVILYYMNTQTAKDAFNGTWLPASI